MLAPFGFSVGDFLAGLELVKEACEALKDASGAKYKFQLALVELESTQAILRRLQAFEPSRHQDSVAGRLQMLGHACGIPVARFLKKLEPYREFLTLSQDADKTISRFGMRTKSKLEWALILQDQFTELRANIAPFISLMDVLLQLQTLNIHELRQDNATLESEVRDLRSTTRDLQNTVCRQLATKDEVKAILPKLNDLETSLRGAYQCNQIPMILRLLGDMSLADLDRHEKVLQGLLNAEKATNAIMAQTQDQTMALGKITSALGLIEACQSAPPDDRDWVPSNQRDHWELTGSALIQHSASKALIHASKAGIDALLLLLIGIGRLLQHVLRHMTAPNASPALLQQSPIQLEDGLGRVSTLPYEIFNRWPVLEAYLKCMFEGRPESDVIEYSQFVFTTVENGAPRIIRLVLKLILCSAGCGLLYRTSQIPVLEDPSPPAITRRRHARRKEAYRWSEANAFLKAVMHDPSDIEAYKFVFVSDCEDGDWELDEPLMGAFKNFKRFSIAEHKYACTFANCGQKFTTPKRWREHVCLCHHGSLDRHIQYREATESPSSSTIWCGFSRDRVVVLTGTGADVGETYEDNRWAFVDPVVKGSGFYLSHVGDHFAKERVDAATWLLLE
ncbi:uncharacterized protein MYCFIDRAFT_85514 [Pseudocercospora fijiensis CIRAD86]|uniref:C2H2-type domain-containing protein n=1 Tax=Pseudocercospora fijiensis (strain CIRAD86) TaxID=383855 RepID=M3B2R8_PSEFD|nr:uncharacterized protein MYCFIDRAFT_85514 [Pseudocercospora fijiensis CIRAD86]EME83682.1 hypothetical protein MYCFIDRAFT_85514 [Pseudocercospora fijiensis CIRAD86]